MDQRPQPPGRRPRAALRAARPAPVLIPRLVLVALVALAIAPAAAQNRARPPEWICEPLIREAERSEGIPAGLLTAIGRAEASATTTEGTLIWPWALNVNGRGVYAATHDEALATIRRSLAEDPRRAVDIGCLQVNWQHHRAAFRDPAELLRPAMNVAYAARFLRNLAVQHGGWQRAAQFYHSGNPARQAAYLAEVTRRFCAAPETAASCARAPTSVVRGPVIPTGVRIYRGSRPPELVGAAPAGATLPFR